MGVTDLELLTREPDGPSSGSPLLLVHGAWHGAWAWQDRWVPYLASQGRRVHSLSLRGHGASPLKGALRWVRIRHYVDDVRRTIDTLGSSPVIVAHSMGSFVVQNLLQAHQAPAAVFLCPVPPGGPWGATFRTIRRMPLTFLWANLTMSLGPLVSTPDRTRTVLFTPDTPQETIDRVAPHVGDESYLAYLDMLLLARPDPRKVRTPVLVVGGGADFLFPPSDSETTARAYGTTAHVVPDSGHDLMLETRWQEAADAMLGWLGAQGL